MTDSNLQTVSSLAHRDVVETSPSQMAAFLQDALGQRFVAHLLGVGDPKTVGRWASGTSNPRGENAERLHEAFYIFWLLGEVESSHTIRAWFAGLNPLLGDESPAAALRNGRSRDVIQAAKAFRADG